MRPFTWVVLVLLGSACGGRAAGTKLPTRPTRPDLEMCLVSNRAAGVAIEQLAGATVDANGAWTARLEGPLVASAGPLPVGCSFTPTRTIVFDDVASTNRFWLGLSVMKGDIDVTPVLPQPVGAVHLTWISQESFAGYQGFSLQDDQGLLLAANLGDLLIEPQDAGGLTTTLRSEVGPTYSTGCGDQREVAIEFRGPSAVTLRPGESSALALAAGTVKVWNLEAVDWVGATENCTDLFDYYATLSWRP